MRASLKKHRRRRARQGIYHAWLSPQQAALIGTVLYRRFDGRQVVVSEVCRDVKDRSRWEDLRYQGPVMADGFVRRTAEGSMSRLPFMQPMQIEEPPRSRQRIGMLFASVQTPVSRMLLITT